MLDHHPAALYDVSTFPALNCCYYGQGNMQQGLQQNHNKRPEGTIELGVLSRSRHTDLFVCSPSTPLLILASHR